mmetsp:Transcript_27928/g.43100  ORF Transcript_27928/g.43100 Transcript_27928/m.43100 type:complete len:84 (-) Transcript_27928:32-283(-)
MRRDFDLRTKDIMCRRLTLILEKSEYNQFVSFQVVIDSWSICISSAIYLQEKIYIFRLPSFQVVLRLCRIGFIFPLSSSTSCR